MDTADTTTATAKRSYRVTAQLKLAGTSGDNLVQLPCSEPGQLEQVAQDCVLSGSDYLRGWRSYNFSGQPVPLFYQPQRKKVSSYVETEFPAFQFVLVASCPSTGHH